MRQARRSWPFTRPVGPQLMTPPIAEGWSFCCGLSAPTAHGSSSHEADRFRLTSRAVFHTGPINLFRLREAVGPLRPLCSRVRRLDLVEITGERSALPGPTRGPSFPRGRTTGPPEHLSLQCDSADRRTEEQPA